MSRRVIIPPGVLNPNQVNIIQVPKILENADIPLLVTPARRGLRAQALPNWKDELSRIVDEDSQLRHLDARSVKCRQDEAQEAKKWRNVTFQNKNVEVPKETKQLITSASREASQYPTNSRETTQNSRMKRNSLPRETSGASQTSYSKSIYGVPSSTPYRETSPRPTSPSLFTTNNGNENRSPSPYRATSHTYPSNRSESPGRIADLSENEQEEEVAEVMCSNKTPMRRVTYVSSVSSKQVDNSPIESESIEIDAPEGIGERRLKQIMDDQSREWGRSSPQNTRKQPPLSHPPYVPCESPIGDFSNGYFPEHFCYSDGYYDYYDDQYESHDESY